MKKGLGFLSLLLAVVSCGSKSSIDMTVEGAANTKLAIYRLNVSSSELLDSVKTNANGSFKYKVAVEKGQPEFVYIYKGDTKLTSLLLEPGQKVKVNADTTGQYTVSGSPSSEELQKVEKAYDEFILAMLNAQDNNTAVQTYISYYRDRVFYVLNNSKSLTTIPVLYQTLNPNVPIFSQNTDAIIFRRVCDSLKTVYPNSKLVRALEVETKNRENHLGISSKLSQAKQVGFPEIALPDVNAQKVSLSGVKAKGILLHFWSIDDQQQKLLNTDVLLPIYKEYHKKGFEIYSVCVSTDKALWASIVKNQKLPWINVCDGKGVASPALSLYNVNALPYSILIHNGEVSSTIKGEAELRKILSTF